MAHGLSHSVGCRIFRSGMEPASSALSGRFFTTGPLRMPLLGVCIYICTNIYICIHIIAILILMSMK